MTGYFLPEFSWIGFELSCYRQYRMALFVIRGFVFTAPFYQIFISICLIDVNIVRLIVSVSLTYLIRFGFILLKLFIIISLKVHAFDIK